MASFYKSLPKLKNSFLNNKSFLYLIALIAFIHIIYFITNKEYSTLLFFCLVATIVYQTNKNMIIVLGYSLISVALLYLLTNIFNILNKPNLMEGLEGQNVAKGGTPNASEQHTAGAEKAAAAAKPKEAQAKSKARLSSVVVVKVM